MSMLVNSTEKEYCSLNKGVPEDGFNNDAKTYNVGFNMIFPSSDNPDANVAFDFETYNSGFYETVQNGLIDTVTEQGSDKFYAERGTELRENVKNTNITDLESLRHYTNFAALDVKTFLNENIEQPKQTNVEKSVFGIYSANEIADSKYVDGIKEYVLEPMALKKDGIELNAVFTSTKNEVIGVTTILD